MLMIMIMVMVKVMVMMIKSNLRPSTSPGYTCN